MQRLRKFHEAYLAARLDSIAWQIEDYDSKELVQLRKGLENRFDKSGALSCLITLDDAIETYFAKFTKSHDSRLDTIKGITSLLEKLQYHSVNLLIFNSIIEKYYVENTIYGVEKEKKVIKGKNKVHRKSKRIPYVRSF
ncbi:MAG TPA: hypothetical protein VJB94_00480 [Candidatus Nanoarchaeia archaeon]|nr:hypothetical protein [Candidatus Nanoarchaeia archaeon]